MNHPSKNSKMNSFFIHINGEEKGPFSVEELRDLKIERSTMVWCNGLDSWTKAADVKALAPLFEMKPPPFQAPAASQDNYQQAHRTTVQPNKGRGLRRIILNLLALIIIGIAVVFGVIAFLEARRNSGYDDSYSTRTSTETYQEKKASVLEIEQANPAKFLIADGSYNKTLFGKKLRIFGRVTNKATVANFKDITIQVRYYSKTESEIGREQFILYDFVKAHSTKEFEWKIKPPSGTNTVGWDVIDAVPY